MTTVTDASDHRGYGTLVTSRRGYTRWYAPGQYSELQAHMRWVSEHAGSYHETRARVRRLVDRYGYRLVARALVAELTRLTPQ